MTRPESRGLRIIPILLLAAGFPSPAARGQAAPPPSTERAAIARFVDLYCVSCHNAEDKAANLALEALGVDDVGRNAEAWEKVVRKLVARQMPPAGEIRPTGRSYDRVVDSLAGALDRAASEDPRPAGRHVPPPQPDRVPERDPGLAGRQRRRGGAPASGPVRSRLRQRDGRRPLAHAAGPVHHRGPEDQPPGRRQPGPFARWRHDPHPRRPDPGGARRGPAGRDARRRPHPLHVPAGRRVRDSGPPGAGSQRARGGLARHARAGGAAGPRPQGVFTIQRPGARATIRPPIST